MNRWFAAAALAAAMVAVPAQAQYAPYPPPPGPAYDPRLDYPGDLPTTDAVFTGLRIEGRIGYDSLDLPATFDEDGDVSFDRHGLSYGGEVGLDFAVGGPVVLGIYGGVDGSTLRQCEDVLFGSACLRPRYLLNAGGRVGVRLGGRALAYAKAGYSNGGIRLNYEDATNPANDFTFRQNLEGYHIGGGIEAAIFPRAYAKLEYVWTRLDRPETGEDDFGNLDRQQLNAGLGMRF